MRLISPIFIFIILHLAFLGIAQNIPSKSIDFRRLKLHEDIDRLQQEILQNPNSLITKGTRQFENLSWCIDGVDSLQNLIEIDTTLVHRYKVKYLTGLFVLMDNFHKDKSLKSLRQKAGNHFLNAYINVIEADKVGASLIELAVVNSYEINSAIFGTETVFFDDPSISKIKIYVYRQFADLFPEKVLPTIVPYLDMSFADTLLILSAKKFPSQFYDYASASQSQVGKKIKMLKDSAVQLLYRIAQEKSGRLLFPFFPLLLNNELKYENLKANVSKDDRYFSMLVNARIVLERKQLTDDRIFTQELDRMINRKSEEVFINQLNARHELNSSERFKLIASFNSEEIFHLIVSGENSLYTSSYNGLYDRMIERAAGKRGDSILVKVCHHQFRKFLKMAAAYNKLDAFLATMPDSTAFSLIQKFAGGLSSAEDIGDAVDVADAYASINNIHLKLLVRNEVVVGLKESKKSRDKQGELIYSLLNDLFDSSKNLQKVLDSTYHIKNVFNVEYADVADISGKVVEQVFFYGDDDGKASFQNFMAGFQDKVAWKIVQKEYWVEIRSLIGKSIWIFANLPLSSRTDPEKYSKAQNFLKRYLDSLKIAPAVLVHRGHSYYLKQTINQCPSNARIILVGSCGGYQLLSTMLDKCINAHIISTKEVGTQSINDPILLMLNESLRNGTDINWTDFWSTLEDQFSKGTDKLRFDNYIPPHKNLGAIFIKAYSSIK